MVQNRVMQPFPGKDLAVSGKSQVNACVSGPAYRAACAPALIASALVTPASEAHGEYKIGVLKLYEQQLRVTSAALT